MMQRDTSPSSCFPKWRQPPQTRAHPSPPSESEYHYILVVRFRLISAWELNMINCPCFFPHFFSQAPALRRPGQGRHVRNRKGNLTLAPLFCASEACMPCPTLEAYSPMYRLAVIILRASATILCLVYTSMRCPLHIDLKPNSIHLPETFFFLKQLFYWMIAMFRCLMMRRSLSANILGRVRSLPHRPWPVP